MVAGGERAEARLTSRGPKTFRHSAIRCKSFKRSVSLENPSPGSTRSLHDDDLGQVDGLASNGRERVLELVERPDQVDSAVSLGRHSAFRVGRGAGRVLSGVGEERLRLWAGLSGGDRASQRAGRGRAGVKQRILSPSLHGQDLSSDSGSQVTGTSQLRLPRERVVIFFLLSGNLVCAALHKYGHTFGAL